MEAFEAMMKRRSYRGMYQNEPVPREDLRKIMEAALAAPSGCNQQTTSLIAVDDPKLIRELGDMLQKPGFASAPAAICVLTKPSASYKGRCYNVQDYAAAIQNALLGIAALGYESCWVEGYITGSEEIGRKMAKLLNVPEELAMVAYLPVGKAAEAGSHADKLPFEKRAWFNGYGQNE